MKKYGIGLAVLISIFSLIGCTSDDTPEPDIIENVMGEVVGPTSCGGNNGRAFEISLTVLPDVDYIVTGTLPEEFKEAGIKIEFDITPSMEGITVCTANFTEPLFYKVSNVRITQ